MTLSQEQGQVLRDFSRAPYRLLTMGFTWKLGEMPVLLPDDRRAQKFSEMSVFILARMHYKSDSEQKVIKKTPQPR